MNTSKPNSPMGGKDLLIEGDVTCGAVEVTILFECWGSVFCVLRTKRIHEIIS